MCRARTRLTSTPMRDEVMQDVLNGGVMHVASQRGSQQRL